MLHNYFDIDLFLDDLNCNLKNNGNNNNNFGLNLNKLDFCRHCGNEIFNEMETVYIIFNV